MLDYWTEPTTRKVPIQLPRAGTLKNTFPKRFRNTVLEFWRALSGNYQVRSHQVKVLWFGACLTVLIGATTHYGRTPYGLSEKPASITDIAVSEDGSLVFIVDMKTRGIYFYRVGETETPPASVSLDSFIKIETNPRIDEPACLAFSKGKLFVCEKDNDRPSIFVLDLSKVTLDSTDIKPISKIIGKPLILEPKGVTVSERGIVAVGDDKLDSVLTFEPIAQTDGHVAYSLRKYEHELPNKNPDSLKDEPERLAFAGEHVVVLDTNGGKLSIVNGRVSGERDETLVRLNELLQRISKITPAVTEFAVHNGIYYISAANRITAFTLFSSHRNFPVLVKTEKEGGTSLKTKVAAGGDYLFVFESDQKRLLIAPRPVPVSINFELATKDLDKAQANENLSTSDLLEKNLILQRNALVNLLEHLNTSNLLQTKTVEVSRNYGKDVRSFLIDERVIFERPYPKDWFRINDNAYLKRLERLLCLLNVAEASLCTAEGELARPISQGQVLRIPDGIEIERTLTTSSVDLQDRTVYDHLRSRIADDQLDPKILADYLLKLNRSTIRTVETTLSDLGFIFPRQLGPQFKPGSLLTFKNGREEIVGDWSGCIDGFDKKIKTQSIDLPPELATGSVDASVPKRSDVSGASLRKFGINKLQVSFEKARIQSIDTLNFGVPQGESASGSGCGFPDKPGEDLYMIDSAIQATADYQFYKNKSRVVLSEEELQEAGVQGTPGSANGSSMRSDSPFYLAYTVRKVERTTQVSSWLSVNQTEKVRPGSSNFVFSISNQTLILPATRWRLSLFLNARDLEKSSSLSELRGTPGVRIFSEEKFPGSYSGTLSSDDDEQEITNNRKDLVDLIKAFPLPEERYKGIIVGVAETVYQDYKNHPELRGVWYRPKDTSDPGDEWVPEDVSNAPSSPLDSDPYSDHALHVAGLIAGRGNSLPGFAKGAKLFLVDTRDSSPATLENQIDIGATRLVKLFNFSFTFGDKQTADVIPKIAATLDNLREKIRSNSDVLFIMAAGNDAKDLARSTLYPIEWARDVPNILGVGATDSDGNPLPLEFGCGAKRCSGGNFGRTHVHLIAPGRDIYSTVTNGYAKASGTSQAAPLVTATAAALMAQGVYGAANIKMRLIYTSDWSHVFEDKVWGGRLNFERAVVAPHRDLVELDNDPHGVYSIKYRNEVEKPLKIKIRNWQLGDFDTCRSYTRSPDGEFECEKEIQWSRVMRIIRYQNEKGRLVYRIMYLQKIQQNTHLRIVNDAELEELTLPCVEAERLDRATNSFMPVPCPPIILSTNLKDFTAAMPLNIKNIRF